MADEGQKASRRPDIRNPLALLALFATIAESGFTVAFLRAVEPLQGQVLVVMAGLAFGTLLLFAIVLIFRPHHLYGPADFQNEANYLALNSRVRQVEDVATTIARRLEMEPLYRYPRLTAVAQRLFLLAYRDSPDKAWRRLLEVNRVDREDAAVALGELVEVGWLLGTNDLFALTEQGKLAYRQIGAFAVDQTMLDLLERASGQ